MRIVMFYHSAWSDWNHGNAHFLRGVATELISRGHDVEIFEPQNSWSYQSLIAEHGEAPLQRFRAAYPKLKIIRYNLTSLDITETLAGADLVLVHEWNDHALVHQIGDHRAKHSHYRLLFHDTHHRMVTQPEAMDEYALENYDGVLAYGEVLRELYDQRKTVNNSWTWHEAADVRIFYPPTKQSEKTGDLVWIGNWGDDERNEELREYLIEPSQALALRTRIHGVRYPENALQSLAKAGIEYAGWLANFEAPQVFANFKLTLHVPRRPYTRALPGIPTIRVFEALACGIPLVCAPWNDVEHLFRSGTDFLVAKNGAQMKRALKALLNDPDLTDELARNGLETILKRHTCGHRVDELLSIHAELTDSKPAILAT